MQKLLWSRKSCTQYQTSPENIIEIITTIYPNVSVKSAKNRLTRLSNALKKNQDVNDSQDVSFDCDYDETF